MEVISNADIARLILGYLNEQCLEKASLAFLKTSPYLKQEYRFLRRGFKPLSLGPESLITIIREYCRIKSRVLHFVESLDVENRYDFIEQASLEGKYQVLLKGYKHKPCSISTNKHEREKHKRRNSSPDTEDTIDSSKINLAKRRRLSTHFVTLHNTKVDIRSNAPQDFPSSKDSSSDSDHETGTKNCPPEVPLEAPDFNDISETRLQNYVFQNNSAETINISKIPSEVSKVIKTPENGKENLQNLNYQRQTPVNGSGNIFDSHIVIESQNATKLSTDQNINVFNVASSLSVENVDLESNVTTQTILTAAVNEPTPIVCKNSISNTYELLIFSETQLPTGQYMYTPIDKPVSIDPRTGEITHISILKCMDKNITSVEFAPNVPNNINSFEQDIQSQKTIQIISDEVIGTQQMTNNMTAFSPDEHRPQNNIQLEVTGNLDPTPAGQKQEIEMKATPPSSTQRKRSHVRNLNFTSPLKVLSKKEEPITLFQLDEPLAVNEPLKSKALNIESFVPQVSSEIAITTENTTKAFEDKSTRSKISDTPKSSFPANTRGRVNTRQAANKGKTQATEIKPNRVLKGERKQSKTKKDKNPVVCEKVVVVGNDVVEKPSMPSIDTMLDFTAKLPKTTAADVKIVDASSLKQNHEPSKSTDNMKIQEMKQPDKTFNQWKKMRQIPRNQMDQHLRKISSELEEKRKAAWKASKRTRVTKKKTEISAEKKTSKLTSKNQKKAYKRSESTKQDEPDVEMDQIKEEELSNLIISKQNQDNVLLSCVNQEIQNAIEEKPPTTIQRPSPAKVSPKSFNENNKLPEKLVDKSTEAQSAEICEEKLSNITTNDRETIEGNTSQNQIQDMSVDQQLTESFICSALLSLETPFKMDDRTNPKTPCVNTPGSLTTPIFKNVTFGGNYSLLKNPDVPTPILAITPGKGLTPFQRSGGSSRYSVRPTDYSSGSSYYKPDECDELDKNFDTNYHKERLHKKSEEEQHSIPASEEKSEDKEQYNSDEWSKSLDTVQTVIKAKKFEPRIGDKLDGEKDGGTKISPCKLETRLSDTESSSSKTTNKSVGSSSRSSSSSNSSSSSCSDDDENHQTKEEIKSKSYCDKNSNIATKIVLHPKRSKVEVMQSNISSSHAKISMPILDKLTSSSKRTSKVSATVASHFQDLEEKRKRVVNKIKGHETKDIATHQKTHIGKKKQTAVPVNKNSKQNHIDTLNEKTETRSLSLKIVDHKEKPQTNREHNVLPKDEEQHKQGIEVIKIKDQSGSFDAKKLATPMKMSSRLIQEMLENDFALTPSKDNISVDDSASVDDKDFVEVEVLQVLDPLVNECDENTGATAQVKQGLEVIVEETKQGVIQETTNDDSEEEEYVDAYGACQVVTYGEEDKDRFISMVYNEKNVPSNIKSTKLSISGQIMNIFLEGLPHKITVEPEIKLFEMIPESMVQSKTKTTKAIKEKQSLPKTKTKVLQIIESERKRIGDPCDSCQAVTFDENDKKRFIKIHYKGKNDTALGKKKKLSSSDSVMPILVDGILHKLNVQKEVELLKMKPSITKSKKTVTAKNLKPVQEELEDTHTLLTTSTPIKPKIKLLHKNRFNKPENDPSIKSGLSKKNPCPTTDGFESSQDYQPTPSSAKDLDQQGNEHSQILPLNAENIKKVLSQTKLENKTSIGAEDINAVLSHLHGS